jgi:hypothetical protein
MSRRFSLILMLSLVTGCGSSFSVGCGSEVEPVQSAAPPAPGTTDSIGSPQTITVAANRGWQHTGITVTPQQKFQLRYRSGQITDKDVSISGAHGSDYVCGDPGCCEPLPDERRASLVARIGTDVFAVGNGGAYSSPSGGSIFLRVNDCDDGLLDNTGELTIEFIASDGR